MIIETLIQKGIFDKQLDRMLELVPKKEVALSPDDISNLIGVVFEAGITAGYEVRDLVLSDTEKVIDEKINVLQEYLHNN